MKERSILTPRGEPALTRPTSYSFRFEHGGWAIFTVNDDTGEFTVQSDWGSYCHRWHIGALGDGIKLTQFLSECDGDYLVRKLQLGTNSKDLDKVFDADETLRALRTEACRLRRHRKLTRSQARDLWEFGARDLNLIADGYIDIGEHLSYRLSDYYVFLRDTLLPFFTSWLRENVVAKQKSVEARS